MTPTATKRTKLRVPKLYNKPLFALSLLTRDIFVCLMGTSSSDQVIFLSVKEDFNKILNYNYCRTSFFSSFEVIFNLAIKW